MPNAEYWGAIFENSLRLPCEDRPERGRPLMLRRDRSVTTRQQLDASHAIKDRSIGVEKLGGTLRDIFFGGGRDGGADFDGTTTVLGHAPSSSIYTLTRDINATRMHVRAGAIIRPSGHRIFCRELHLWGTAIIHADGGTGADGATPGAGGKGVPVLSETSANNGTVLGGGEEGADGGAGATVAAGVGGNGGIGGSIAVGLGGDGRIGSNGQDGTGAGTNGTGGNPGTVAGTNANAATLDNATRLMRGPFLIHGGAGGGGGGGGGASAANLDGGGGGAGGAGGGVIMIAADEIVLHSWTGRISANGGNGGVGGAAEGGGAGTGGGGGGGGGGLVVVVYTKLEGGVLKAAPLIRNVESSTSEQNTAAANVSAWGGRQGGTSGGPLATVWAPGGTVFLLGPEPFVPVAEIPAFAQFTRGRVRRARGFIQNARHKLET